MCIFSVVPEEFYQDTFLKANKISEREDLYTPEYDHLGMQPLFGYEVNKSASASGEIQGWQYRYEQWKRRFNRCTSIFRNTAYDADDPAGSLSSWIHTIQPYRIPTIGLDTPNSRSYSNFMHDPSEMNDIFLVSYQINYSQSYASRPYTVYECDPFVVNSHIDCVKVSTMSDYSLPRLDA